MDKQVNVLISTYNGEKYIREQVDSILNQSYSNIKIFIRDDGSTDQTVSVLRQKYGHNPSVVLFAEENIGYRKSFVKLLEIVQEGAYWAFCDQDDVWLEDKVKWAVEWMEGQPIDIPCLFHNSFQLVDEDLQHVLGAYCPPKYEIDFRRAITDSVFQGFSIMMNCKLRELMLECNSASNYAHDWMAGLIALEFGKTCFDARIAALHRRMNDSASAMTIKNRIRWFLRTLSGESDVKNTAKEFYRVFGREQNSRNIEILKWFTHDKFCMSDTIKKVFYPKRWRQSIASEISIRLLMLLQKI